MMERTVISGSARASDLMRFYTALDKLEDRLGGARRLRECSAKMGWPARGVYFFREAGELRSGSGTGPRIVRVGTHALAAGSRTTLWNRLSQHRGNAADLRGNHRGSIFRLLIGTALMRDDGSVHPTWGQGNSAPAEIRAGEAALEIAVSRRIGEMPFLWLPVTDEPGPSSLRGTIERNSIGLLSEFGREPVDPPSTRWLGYRSDRARVRQSGLWNSNHVDESYEAGFLDVLERLIDAVPQSEAEVTP